MARVPLYLEVKDTFGNVVSGAVVTVRKRSDNSLATLYQAEAGGTTLGNPLSSDSLGRVSAFIDRGAFNVGVTGTGITPYTVPYDAAAASDNGVDAPWVSPAAMPLGVIMPYAGATDPAGGAWLICDGRAVSRATYSTLFTAIGTTFGVGDGTTTFNLPDLRGRTPVGVGTATGAAGATAHTLGQKGGEETHALTTAEMPSHAHGGATGTDSPDHTHTDTSAAVSNNGAFPGAAIAATGASYTIGTITTGGASARHTHTIGAEGGGTAHGNMQPYLGLNFVIRAL